MKEFLERMREMLGDEYGEFLKYYEKDEPRRGLRVNTLKCSADKLREIIGFPLEKTPFCEEGFYLPEGTEHIGASPLHHAGAFYVQEPSATSAVTMLDVQPGDKVLDLCAAPGGKSTQIAAKLNGKGLLWSNEIVRNRALILLSNIERIGVRNAVVSNCHPDMLCGRLTGFFNKILVDAPCSGEGMFRKNSSAKDEWSVEHVKSCAARQLQILESAKFALAEGGLLVYSTCTFSREENEVVIREFLRLNPGFEIVNTGVSFGRPAFLLNEARRIFPMDGGEGHFAVCLRRLYANEHIPTYNSNKENISKYMGDVFSPDAFGGKCEIIRDKLYAFGESLPDISGLSVLRKGVLLGELKKNRVEPCHAAFMAAKEGEYLKSVDLDLDGDDIKKFLHGEEIPVDSTIKGYTAVKVCGITTGFGKASGGTLKNKYPKGLRNL